MTTSKQGIPLASPNTLNTETIRSALLKGEIVTVQSALHDYGILSLPQIIYYLRKQGVPIQVSYSHSVRSDGRAIKYAAYSVEAPDANLLKGDK